MLRLCSSKLRRGVGIINQISNSASLQSSNKNCHAVTSLTRAFSSLDNTSTHQDAKNVNGGGEIIKFLTLNNIKDNPGAKKKAKRVGRGTGSGRGKTCGRGHKGQKARSGGGPPPHFEGGQTALYKRLPKRGFTNVHATPMLPLNIGTLQDYIDMGRINLPGPGDDDPPLTMKDLVDAGIMKHGAIKHGVKLLASGKERLRSSIKIEVSRASSAAIEAIESVGGEVTTVHYNKLALRALLKPHKFDIIPKRAKPPPNLLTYYTSYDSRGYLSAEMQMKKLYKRLAKEEGENKDE
mmetsp:Transcript_19855/g.24497  ORF Transcript_19855/g.24497 Transcript_19855/m.24497 type:complete len:294 (+) Transcript_19855:65-946(+)|eukprot:CAMPEP_0172500906 /NCGR_PEP_ID=MMETSP1066-20121228/143978_1 /TAXON_ID=671091 /ORGANISM="Coscinodiscus wailesii, Strain CCMP2513" /LENGTH=293 /DNA_ID=CAMNT_0013275393 /DNA_START=51 /DNA_END=932 /DNA_ORIENTATION=+